MKKSIVLSLLAALACAASAAADTVYDNIDTNGSAGPTVGTTVGQSFVTGNVALTLNAFVFAQNDTNGAYTFTTGETVTLYGNDPTTNAPGPLALASFTLSSIGQGLTEADVNATTALTANTRYWLVLTTPNASTVYWTYYNPAGYTANSADGVTLPEVHTAYKAVNGTTTYYSFSGDGPQSIYLDANVLLVPEPSTWAMLALGGFGVLVAVRRARAARVA